MKLKFSLLFFILIFVLGCNSKERPESNSEPTPEPQKQERTIPNQQEKYTNPEAGFSLNYPSNLIQKNNAFYTSEALNSKNPDGLIFPEFSFTVSEQNTKLDDYIKASINPSYTEQYEKNKNSIKKEIYINENKFTQISNLNFDDAGCMYFLENKNNQIIRFSTHYNCGEDDEIKSILGTIQLSK